MNPSCDFANEMMTGGVKPSSRWTEHFWANRHREWSIPWQHADPPPREAVVRIAGSIAEFQRGESSEARTYLAKSELFSARTGDPDFHTTSVLFVMEENEHAALLLRFMQLAGIPPNRRSVGDRIFRALRAVSDLGWTSRVLIIAELIAQEYYPCLRAATNHPALVRICDTIICDEDAHIRFQVERIVRVEASLGPLGIALRDFLQIFLMAGAAVVVHRGHHRVLSTRLSFGGFLANTLARTRRAVHSMRALRSSRNVAPAGNGSVSCSGAL
ncbi:MAG TPA: ferritin-like domain-containing protein [Lacunisphaera sp.]|nr:ferritin-like domain-containing protein [Lacunisphaera sp.]